MRIWSGQSLAAAAVMFALAVGASSAAEKKATWKGSIPISMTDIAKGAKISQADAEKAALAARPGKIVSTELATESDSLLYEVKVQAGKKTHEVLVDAGTGKVVTDGKPGSILLGLAKRAKLSRADAQQKALAAVEGPAGRKSVGDSELEVENDFLVYEIDVKVKGKPGTWEVIVDAGDGKVLATEHETGGGD